MTTLPTGAIAQRHLDDGRILTVYPEIFETARLLVDDNPAMHNTDRARANPADTESDGGADAYYQYGSVGLAIAALERMTVDDREPSGWTRASDGFGLIRRPT